MSAEGRSHGRKSRLLPDFGDQRCAQMHLLQRRERGLVGVGEREREVQQVFLQMKEARATALDSSDSPQNDPA